MDRFRTVFAARIKSLSLSSAPELGDEEPPEDVYSEGNARWTEKRGMSFMTFTPMEGMSKVVIRFVNQEGIIATPNWTKATDWLTRFAYVLATGDNLDCVISRCREVAQSVILSGNTSDTPASRLKRRRFTRRLAQRRDSAHRCARSHAQS